MRMWMIDPRMLCKKHLLGEHGEIHKFRHSFVKGTRINGRLSPVVQIEPAAMKSRHDELTSEMEIRFGKTYNSPYEQPDLSAYSPEQVDAKADLEFNVTDLSCRCPDCRERILSFNSEKQ